LTWENKIPILIPQPRNKGSQPSSSMPLLVLLLSSFNYFGNDHDRESRFTNTMNGTSQGKFMKIGELGGVSWSSMFELEVKIWREMQENRM